MSSIARFRPLLAVVYFLAAAAPAFAQGLVFTYDGHQTFLGSNRFAGPVLLTNLNNTLAGTFLGNGAGLTNLPPGALAGVLGAGQLPAGVVYAAALAATSNALSLRMDAITLAAGNGRRLSTVDNGVLGAGQLPAGVGYAAALAAASNALSLRMDAMALATEFLRSGLSTVDKTLTLSAGFEWEVPPGADVAATSNRGYLITNAIARTDFTLPATLDVGQIGQTIRLRDLGGRGWRLVQGAGQSIRTASQYSYGSLWVQRQSAKVWSSIAASSDGSKLAAVFGQTNIVLSSNFGLTWTENRTLPAPASGVAMSADGTNILTAGSTLAASTDSGATWANRNQSRTWSAITVSRDGSRQFATENAQIHVSTNFFVTSASNALPGAVISLGSMTTSLKCSLDGTRLVASGGSTIFTSADAGVSWTSHPVVGANVRAVAMSADGNKIIAVGPSVTLVSVNGGLSFQTVNTDPVKSWSCVALSASGEIALAGNNVGLLHISTDLGATWLPFEATRRWREVSISDDGTKMTAISNDGLPIHTLDIKPQSTLGSGGNVTGGPHSAVELVYAGNGQFVVTSSQGLVTPQ